MQYWKAKSKALSSNLAKNPKWGGCVMRLEAFKCDPLNEIIEDAASDEPGAAAWLVALRTLGAPVWAALPGLAGFMWNTSKECAIVIQTLPVAIDVLAGLRPAGLRGMSLPEALSSKEVHPARLLTALPQRLQDWRRGLPAD